jgi:hypothetical protein
VNPITIKRPWQALIRDFPEPKSVREKVGLFRNEFLFQKVSIDLAVFWVELTSSFVPSFNLRAVGELTAGFSFTTSRAYPGELSAVRVMTGLNGRAREFGESSFSKALHGCRRPARHEKECCLARTLERRINART